MDFTTSVESLKPMADIVQILTGLGVVTVALAYGKYSAERRCWRRFKRRANGWVDRQVELKGDATHQDVTESDDKPSVSGAFEKDVLTIVVEGMLSDAGFTPLQSQQLLDMSILLVKGIAADKFLV
jgi:hypothetical protein